LPLSLAVDFRSRCDNVRPRRPVPACRGSPDSAITQLPTYPITQSPSIPLLPLFLCLLQLFSVFLICCCFWVCFSIPEVFSVPPCLRGGLVLLVASLLRGLVVIFAFCCCFAKCKMR
jgi:hypothetical protein